MRLAWFTPWPPQTSGVAGCSAAVVAALAARGYAIDVFVDERHVPVERADDGGPVAGAPRLQSAHDFVWRAAKHQYDLTVYQLGNSAAHDFIWPYMFRWSGLVVLHDARLHHARGRALLLHKREDAYRAEFVWNHPDHESDLAELAIAGFDGGYYYQWPMLRAVVASARLVATHARGAAAELRTAFPQVPVEYVALGEGRTVVDADGSARRRFRAAHGLPDSSVVFGVFGALTAEKRVPQVLQAFAAAHAVAPHARLILVGVADPHLDLPAQVAALGLAAAVTLTGAVDDDTFQDAIAASDVSLCLRWPTALETSGPWVCSLAAGRPTVLVDLPSLAHIPTLDPRTWRRHAPCPDLAPDADSHAVAMAIDILDERHSLRLALKRLAADAELRDRMGAAARAYWEAEHTVDRMVADYERALALAASRPAPAVDLPPHLRPDPARHARQIAAMAGDVPIVAPSTVSADTVS